MNTSLFEGLERYFWYENGSSKKSGEMQAEYKPMRVGYFYNESFVQQYYKAIQRVWHAKDYKNITNSCLTPIRF